MNIVRPIKKNQIGRVTIYSAPLHLKFSPFDEYNVPRRKPFSPSPPTPHRRACMCVCAHDRLGTVRSWWRRRRWTWWNFRLPAAAVAPDTKTLRYRYGTVRRNTLSAAPDFALFFLSAARRIRAERSSTLATTLVQSHNAGSCDQLQSYTK